MAGTPFTTGPQFIGSSAGNLTSPNVYMYQMIKQIWLANVTASPVSVNIYVGASGGSSSGTQLAGGLVIQANAVMPLNFYLKLDNSQYISASASSGSAVTATVGGDLIPYPS